MPMYETAIPIGATALIAEDDDGETYTLTVGTATFVRVAEDGNQLILPLFGGDEFVGEVLEGFWKKGWSTDMNATQAFTAIIDGSGTLEFEGEADVAGVAGVGWINGHLPLPLLNETEVTVSMQVPVDDTGGTANRDIQFNFYLRREKAVNAPSTDDDYLKIRIDVDESGLLILISKMIATVETNLFDGSTYDDASARATGDFEGQIWRIVIHNGVTGATAPENVRHLHIYLKQDDTIANAESATENELTTSPYDISDLGFNVAYPCLELYSQITTIYDAGNEAKSTYVRVDYPDFDIKYDIADSDRNKGEVELWDGDPAVATSQRVFDEDHVFTNDPYLQNGLTRIHVDRAASDGLLVYVWSQGAWFQASGQFRLIILDTPTYTIKYPELRSIVQVSTEKTILRIRLHNSAVYDSDAFVDFDVVLERGKWLSELQFIQYQPQDEVRVVITNDFTARFVPLLDDQIYDSDLAISASNTTMSDNFFLQFDDTEEPILFMLGMNYPPDYDPWRYDSSIGRMQLRELSITQIPDQILHLGAVPFPLIANLFAEAEDETLGGGATSVVDAAASNGNAVLLNAQNETVYYDVTAGTDLPEGRYLFVFRLRDINQVADDVSAWVINTTDGDYRNEENYYYITTATASYAYYSVVFDITDADVSGTDNIRIRVKKRLADANDLYVDYFLIIPIGDGESFPQDLAHAAMRGKTQSRRVYER